MKGEQFCQQVRFSREGEVYDPVSEDHSLLSHSMKIYHPAKTNTISHFQLTSPTIKLSRNNVARLLTREPRMSKLLAHSQVTPQYAFCIEVGKLCC